jgi:uncharacterized protein
MSLLERFQAWCGRTMPRREVFEQSRWLRPVAHRVLRPELWRFTRRSVPRGVALGMLVGVLIPVAQTVFAALFALPARANVPVAALTTFVTNPFTTPPIWAFALWLGRKVLQADAATTGGVIADQFRPEATGLAPTAADWLQWLVHDVGPALSVGLLIVAGAGAAISYVVSGLAWRLWIGRKWRRRAADRLARRA